MTEYKKFIFKDYNFSVNTKTLTLIYSYDNLVHFSETYKFNFDFIDYNPDLLDRAIQALYFMAGISYYKAYLAPAIVIEKGEVDENTSKFLSKTYRNGLAEFFYVNKLDPKFEIIFPINNKKLHSIKSSNSNGLIIGIGGGKDSLVSVELLRDIGYKISTWSLGHKSQLEPLINRIGLPHFWVERNIDKLLLEHNGKGALNGHIPISAIFACVGSIVAILTGKKDSIVSNENSANEPDLIYQGVQVNHQYSKSLIFEKDYQGYMIDTNQTVNYYSSLRPFSEVYISEIFSKIGFNKYKGVFSSCNRAFTHESTKMFWCGECPKCAFTFLALTPFIDREELELIWGKNLLLEPKLEPIYRNLLGISGNKPLDCVGELKESRAAMRLAQKIYSELYKYSFEIPESYNYRKIGNHSMPVALFNKIINKLKSMDN